MISLGFLALGAFVGGIVGMFLLKSETTWSNPVTGLTAMLGAAISGAPIALAQYIVGDTGLAPAFAMYPVGLVLGILTPFLQYAANNYKSTDGEHRRLGILHYAGYGAIVLFGVSVFIAPGYVPSYFGSVDQYFIEAYLNR